MAFWAADILLFHEFHHASRAPGLPIPFGGRLDSKPSGSVRCVPNGLDERTYAVLKPKTRSELLRMLFAIAVTCLVAGGTYWAIQFLVPAD
jgi:hypothetical protein